MKKIIILLVVVVILGVGGYFMYNNLDKEEGIPVLDVQEEHVSISEYYIYGDSLNIVGNVKDVDTNYKNVDLVLYNGEFISFEITVKKDITNLSFYVTEELNDGLYIDDIPVGEYPMFLRFTYEDENEEGEEVTSYKYYVLDNDTEYDNVTYYTVSTYNNMITINSDNDYGTMMFKVNENNESEIYDVVIDPGHGGEDGGAAVGDDIEADLSFAIGELVKNDLEEAGYKVKLTREENQFTKAEYFEEYNVEGVDYTGRAVIPQEVHAKYVLSLHMNSSTASYVKGLEIYTSDNINYDFAELLVDSIKEGGGMDTSSNTTHRISDGIYVHNFSESEIKAAKDRYDRLGYKHYEPTTKSNYLYMIRETGGYMTGAYVDDSNPSNIGVNPYYNSNIGVETYLLEMGYLTNSGDLDKIKNSKEDYAKAIAKAMIMELKREVVSE